MKINIGDVVAIAVRVERLYEGTDLFYATPLTADGVANKYIYDQKNVRSVVSTLPPVPGEIWIGKTNTSTVLECVAVLEGVVYYRWKSPSKPIWTPSTTTLKAFLMAYERS